MPDSRASCSALDLARLFPGDGEMARRMRAFDWSRTPLGPAGGWPQSLRTSVSILLKSRHPMFLWWGPELVQLYNDGYRPSLGAHKHPAALGQRGRECWEEIWPIIGPQIEGVMERGEETWHEDQLVPFDRNGFLEEIYFTYSYSPIGDESGGVGGTLVVCSETTERVLGERRLRALRDLSATASVAREVEDACATVLEVLAAHPRDLPFAVLYLVASGGGSARLAGAAGVEENGELAPREIELETDVESPWPLAEVLRARRAVVVEDLGKRFAEVPARPWPERPIAAVALPVAAPGHEEAVGVLVAAVSPRLALDEGYRDFLDLVTAQVAACLANARAYEEERRRAQALAELDRAKTAFFSNVSHEFRTPLTLALGPLEEALARSEPRLEGEELETVHRNSLRLLRLVNQLLDFSRIEARRFEARFEPLDLAALTAELASTFRSLVETASLRLVVDCPPLEERVYVDREAWEKVVLNLLSNAFKFTFEGEIGVRLRSSDGHVELTVWDTGTGIPQRELPRVFERFHRVRDARSRTHEGSGIGLALVRELVHRHGGAIEVDSAEGEGTTFRIALPTGSAHLPAEQVASDDSARRDPMASALPFVEEAKRWLPDVEPALASGELVTAEVRAAGELGAARLLLADDNRDLRAYLTRLLGEIWQVEAVADGAAALERARNGAFDLVIADVMMPRLDGFELLEKLRSDPVTAPVPVILLSARAGEEARVEGLEAGADDYVVKPFTARELVARIRSQLMMARLRASAESARHELHELFLNAPAAISILRGPELTFEFVNEMYTRLAGRNEIVGKPLREAFPELEEQGLVELFEGVMRTGEPYFGREMPVDLDRGEAPERGYFTYVLQPIHGADGAVEGVASFGFEVTELVEARQRMERLAEQAQVEARRKDEFLAMLGHELRNPLAPIQNAVALLKAEPGELEEKELRWALEIVDRQLAQMSRLVDDLLDVARITRGTVRLRKRRVVLATVVSDAVEALGSLYEERGLRLEVELPAEPVWIEADPLRLTQVIANLLNNAAKYSETGGRVRVVAKCGDGRCVLEVIDEGVGIDPETLPYVFDLFAQADRSLDRSSGGLGIGLTVVKRLVELHGGRVEAHSDGPGRGSRFVVGLPVVEAPAEAARGAAKPAAEAPTAGRRVLVVDDNRDAADSLAMLLEVLGYEVRTALDGEAALTAAQDFEPEAVLLDIGLPKMDGFEVARRLRAEHGPGPLIVALTGYGRGVDRERSRQAGFDHHLLKPADVEEIKRLLSQPRRAEGMPR